MRYFLTAATFLLIVTQDVPLAAQYPGQYPPGGGNRNPGGYPGSVGGGGIPIPRRGKSKKNDKSNQPQLLSLSGVLQKIDDSSVTIVAKDMRTITAKRTDVMKVYKKGAEVPAASLTTGYNVRIDATQDDEGFYHAVALHIESEATAQEKSDAEAAASPSTQKADGDNDRPVIRRKQGSAESEGDTEKAETAPDQEGVGSSRSAIEMKDISDGVDPDRPKQRRGKPASHKSTTVETATTPPEPRVVATSQPPKREIDFGNSSARTDDAMITKAREAVASYTESLPNYFCQQHVARFASTTQKVDWRPLDVLSATVVLENGRDQYRDLKVNGKPVKQRMEELGGSWSTGEFGMVAADLFSRATAAAFTSRGSSSIGGHDAVSYDFEVDRENSHWHIQAPSQSIMPAYRGRVWLQKESAAILRIEMQTYRMPKEFPFDKVESAVDYEYVRLGEAQFLLPIHAETLTCVRGTSDCSRNVIDFRNYHKYAGDSTITFDK